MTPRRQAEEDTPAMTETAHGPGPSPEPGTADPFDTERALATLRALCVPEMEGRAPGSAGHDLATRFLVSELTGAGLRPVLEHFAIEGVLRLAAPPYCGVEGPGLVRDLVHRAEFAEHPRSAPMPRPVSALASEDARPGHWTVVRGSTRGTGFAELADTCAARGAVGILVAQHADASGYLTKRVQGPTPVRLPVVALLPELLDAVTGGTVTAHVPLERVPAVGTNIVATLPGRVPDARPILLTAHYDGVGSDPGRHFPCAGDNASGTAVLCEAARVLGRAEPLDRPVTFALLDGEEMGTLGSAHHARQLRERKLRPDVLNIDMAGKFNGKVAVELGPADPVPAGLVAALDASGRRLHIPLHAAPVASDNRRYAAAGFPSAGVGLGAAHYHSPLDNPERIEADALHKAGLLTLATVRHLAARG
ncbi:M28 family peptidase [Streptomyces sp. SID8350]|nr:M28 family peptidase [Streptomyces sp. SID8350]SCK21124.1 Predicted aminopeptidases [Streptomyces sp. AmelKG-D3]